MPYDPKKSEDEWFAKHEREMLQNLKRERERKEIHRKQTLEEEEATKRRELHYMKCPKCGSDMKEKDVVGIKVDECTSCEGIYFDRGELEDLLLKKVDDRRSFMRRITGLFRS